MYESSLDAGPRPDTAFTFDQAKAKRDLIRLLFMARRSRHTFLIYLLGLALEEIKNIESGRPSDI